MLSRPSIAIVTSIHPDFDSRIWKHAKSLVEVGSDVHLVCPWGVDSSCHHGVHFHPFRRVEPRILRPFLLPMRVFSRLLPLCPTVDLVHFHDLDLLPWMTLVSCFKPVVYDVHENYAEEMMDRDYIPDFLRTPLHRLVKYGQSVFSLMVGNIVLVAPSQEKDFSHPKFRVVSIRNYASLDLLRQATDNHLSRADAVAFVGSGYESNGCLLLLDVARLSKERHPALRFLVPDKFASDEIRHRFFSARKEMGLEACVEVYPRVHPHAIMEILNRATIAISPNLRVHKQEIAIPTKLFEYMAAGLPIVSSDLPFAKDLLSRHPIGILAQPEKPESFAEAIHRLIVDPGLARRLGKTGQAVFTRQYCWESQIPQLLKFYEEILATR